MSLALALSYAHRSTGPDTAFTEACLWETSTGAECGQVISTDDPFFCHRHDTDTAEYDDQHAHQRGCAVDAGHDYLA